MAASTCLPSPPLSTVRLPMRQLGAMAVQVLKERLDNPTAPVKRVLLPGPNGLRVHPAPDRAVVARILNCGNVEIRRGTPIMRIITTAMASGVLRCCCAPDGIVPRGPATRKWSATGDRTTELNPWEGSGITLSDEHATHGKKSLRVNAGETIRSSQLPQDWSGYESLDIDCFVDGDAPVSVAVIIFDKAAEAKHSYWNPGINGLAR